MDTWRLLRPIRSGWFAVQTTFRVQTSTTFDIKVSSPLLGMDGVV
ncbi:MAG: hypothetical protein ACLU4J_19130 [Butyricimonas paravirosa]